MEVIVLTGDNEKTAKAMSSKLDIDRVITSASKSKSKRRNNLKIGDRTRQSCCNGRGSNQ